MSLIGVLADLEKVLITKKENLTPQEANILHSWKTRFVSDFTASALAGSAAAWTATLNVSKAIRTYLSVGAGTIFGNWLGNRILYSRADQILTMDGSILQKELANIMVTKYQNDPSVMQLMSKHFYLERIFDDSSNNPKLRWRYRNFFSEAVHGHRTHDQDSYDKSEDHSHNDSNDKSQGRSENVTNSQKPNLETKHTFINSAPDTSWEPDPLDCVFGYAHPLENTINSDSPNKQPSGTQNRVHRRSRRRRRMRDHETLSNSESTATV
ncbi:uncharacterized protein LOC114171498 isoform X2 [Vigna unguiculata]|uniref:Uncharacterized protein n=1 Tax=Vigna unguiculata TaxID=3917 RepID=A0A4D6LTN2_VIGUN|nr:uncharacterized protein LOC114171498 isoform X2 [Vigna unguiculata]QCD91840.1 hypothetical protein DEO72_LG4g2808 [Vigna unguiculata]